MRALLNRNDINREAINKESVISNPFSWVSSVRVPLGKSREL